MPHLAVRNSVQATYGLSEEGGFDDVPESLSAASGTTKLPRLLAAGFRDLGPDGGRA
jgi:hypothetical protein